MKFPGFGDSNNCLKKAKQVLQSASYFPQKLKLKTRLDSFKALILQILVGLFFLKRSSLIVMAT